MNIKDIYDQKGNLKTNILSENILKMFKKLKIYITKKGILKIYILNKKISKYFPDRCRIIKTIF